MKTLRTPEQRFERITDFPFEPQYAHVPDDDGDELRVAYLEAGRQTDPVVVMLHGEPSWSYLYRHVIPPVVDAGYRVIAPDLVGFGRSDKPSEIADHTYARHVEWMRSLLFDELDLTAVTLVGQDWGGLIGLRLAGEHPDRFSALVVANTGLPTGDQQMPDVWLQFREAVKHAADLDIARLIQSGTLRELPSEVLAAYDAPFPTDEYKAGPRAMPSLVPAEPDNPACDANRQAWQVLTNSNTPVLVAFSDSDPITSAMGPIFRKVLPGAVGRDHPVIANAGHFLQEDAGTELGNAVAAFLKSLPHN